MSFFQSLILVLSLLLNLNSSFAQSDAPVKPAEAESSDYEVDYEEEPGSVEAAEPEETVKPALKTKSGKAEKFSKDTTSQGSRAEKKIAPMMKSETKSVYRKNGKPLDVDTD